MSYIAYINGHYLPHRQGTVSIDDRGFQFADAIYEVIAIQNGTLLSLETHLERFKKSLLGIDINLPHSNRALKIIGQHLIACNSIQDGMLYIQVSRGIALRDHGARSFPKPTLVITARPAHLRKTSLQGIRVITVPDQRWYNCNLKSISLLANVLAYRKALNQGAQEAWQVRNGTITESCKANVWIITPAGVAVTHPADNHILQGVTRSHIIDILRELGHPYQERTFTVEEAKQAAEAFNCATISRIVPVTQIDDTVIGNGQVGPITRLIHEKYTELCDHSSRKES